MPTWSNTRPRLSSGSGAVVESIARPMGQAGGAPAKGVPLQRLAHSRTECGLFFLEGETEDELVGLPLQPADVGLKRCGLARLVGVEALELGLRHRDVSLAQDDGA